MNRRGFTLTELLVAMSVMAILGVSLTRILVNDSRFVSRQDAMLSSRQSARAALNTVLSELSMVADTVVVATRDSMTVRVPVAFGITCRAVPATSDRIVSLLPVDSVAWAGLDTVGLLWRYRTGDYQRVNMIGIATTWTPADSGRCTADSVRMLPGGKLIKVFSISKFPLAPAVDSLAMVVMYSRVTYAFAPSADLPGRIGLWRKPHNGVAEELVAPFDTSARFAYLMGGSGATTLSVQTNDITTPAGLDSILGVELRLYAASESMAQGTSAYQIFPLKTHVRFANR